MYSLHGAEQGTGIFQRNTGELFQPRFKPRAISPLCQQASRGFLLILAVLAMCMPALALDSGAEKGLLARGAFMASRYAASPPSYTYAPHQDARERAASSAALTAHVMLEAYLAGGSKELLEKARIAGDGLIANADMNGDKTAGWGRFWPKIERSHSMPGDGSNTSFAIGCTLARNRPYDDEIYDDARIGHFLLDLYQATRDTRYLETTRRMIEATWNSGETTLEGGFYYYKTIGPCDRGWHVKNVNMLMAVPMALMAKITGEAKYLDRARAMMKAEALEVRRTVKGSAAPNLGYLAIQTMRAYPTQGTYVSRLQSTNLDQTILCNPKTGSGESCWMHLGLEARSVDLVNRILGKAVQTDRDDVLTLMSGVETSDPVLCHAPKTPMGQALNWTHCAAYYCALRRLKAQWSKLCLERVPQQPFTQDVALGLFWGQANRY